MTLTIPKQKFSERLDALPAVLRSVAFSTETGALLSSICKNFHLDDEKGNTVIMFATAVLLGFLHRTDLAKEIQDGAQLDAKVAQSIADEVERKLLSRVQTDIDRIYEPVLTTEGSEKMEVPALSRAEVPALSRAEVPTPTRVEATPVARAAPSAPFAFSSPHLSADKTEKPSTPETRPPSSGPMMLHEEKSIQGEKRGGFKGFSIPLGFLKSKAAPAAPKAAARVEIPENISAPSPSGGSPERGRPPARGKGGVRTVHYNELRTPLSPFGQREEFINLETFEKFASPSPFSKKGEGAPPSKPTKPPATRRAEVPALSRAEVPALSRAEAPAPSVTKATPAPSAAGVPPPPQAPPPAPEGGEPKLKGNVVDLR